MYCAGTPTSNRRKKIPSLLIKRSFASQKTNVPSPFSFLEFLRWLFPTSHSKWGARNEEPPFSIHFDQLLFSTSIRSSEKELRRGSGRLCFDFFSSACLPPFNFNDALLSSTFKQSTGTPTSRSSSTERPSSTTCDIGQTSTMVSREIPSPSFLIR